MPHNFEEFFRTGKLIFEISAQNHAIKRLQFYGLTGIQVDIELFEKTVQQEYVPLITKFLNIKLTQEGNSLFVTKANETIEFIHQRREVRIIKSFDDGPTTEIEENLGGSKGEYAFISPISTWSLEINPEIHIDFNINQIKQINLRFKCYGLPI